MVFTVIDPATFLTAPLFRQDDFLSGVAAHNWQQYRDRAVLVRGCGEVLTPPWAYMVIASRLAGLARSVRYGNEHDHVVVYRADNPGKGLDLS